MTRLNSNHGKVTHADFQWQIVKVARLKGWKVQYWWRTFKSPKGFLDLVLVRPAKLDKLKHVDRIIFSELKIPPDTLSDEQKEWIEVWSQIKSVEVYLWTPENFDEICRILE